jgi:protease II
VNGVQSQPYPHLLVTAATEDSRVRVDEIATWAQRVRSASTRGVVLLDLESGGHHGSGAQEGIPSTITKALAFAISVTSASMLEDS